MNPANVMWAHYHLQDTDCEPGMICGHIQDSCRAQQVATFSLSGLTLMNDLNGLEQICVRD